MTNMKNINIEVEGGEILIQSKEGHYAIIPAKHRREIEDMVKDNCENCINSYIQSLPKESDYAEDGTLIPGWDDIKATLNPYNWGVTDYTKSGTRGQAYNAARKAGEKEFMYNDKRYNTKYDGTASQQLKETGLTNEQIQNRNIIQERLSNNLIPIGYTNMENRVWDAVIKNKKAASTEGFKAYSKNKERQDAYNLYMGKPQKNNTFNVSKYTPNISKEKNIVYYSLNNEDFKNILLLQTGDFDNQNDILEQFDDKGNPDIKKKVMGSYENVMGSFTLSKGSDDRGNYMSYYDKWDIAPMDFGKPYEIYDRVYYKDYGDGKQKRMYYSDKELSALDANKKDFNALDLQKELVNRGYELPNSIKSDNTFDGVYGDETRNALLNYQTKKQ